MHVGPTRILLIDDDAVDRQMVRRALKASYTPTCHSTFSGDAC
jgi:hypothetical protein